MRTDLAVWILGPFAPDYIQFAGVGSTPTSSATHHENSV